MSVDARNVDLRWREYFENSLKIGIFGFLVLGLEGGDLVMMALGIWRGSC